jgi:hypothetical protein
VSLTATVYATLTGDAALVGMLATYKGSPAVFTTDPPPSSAQLPYIVTAGDLATNPFDTKDSQGEEIYRDIRCYTPASGSSTLVDAIADRVKALLHRQPLVVDGREVLLASVSGPRSGPVEEKAYARVVTLRVVTNPA